MDNIPNWMSMQFTPLEYAPNYFESWENFYNIKNNHWDAQPMSFSGYGNYINNAGYWEEQEPEESIESLLEKNIQSMETLKTTIQQESMENLLKNFILTTNQSLDALKTTIHQDQLITEQI